MYLFFIILFIYIFLFFLSIKKLDNSIVDIFWGTGFVIIAIYFYFLNKDYSINKSLVLILIVFWGIRLSYYILKRKLKEKSEDPRYAIWRKSWKYFYIRSFFQVYIVQMLLMFLIATTIYFIFLGNINSYLFILGFTISIIGLIFEIFSDLQVKSYIEKNGKTNEVFTGGLYKYSRNPNYFGESMFWLGLAIIGSSTSLWSFLGYFVITFLLLFVSGIPLKEKRQETKINWKIYKSKTNKFIPWLPKK